MTKLRKVLLGLVATVAAMGLFTGAASADTATLESEFVSHINDLRASQGLGTLSVNSELTGMARDWASQMAAASAISHRTNLADASPSDWQKVGENVGVGGSVDTLHAAFVASPGHYANLVDPAFQEVGVGVVEVDGIIYVAENFMVTRSASQAQAAAVAGSVATASAGVRTITTKLCKGKGKSRRCTTVRKTVKKKAPVRKARRR